MSQASLAQSRIFIYEVVFPSPRQSVSAPSYYRQSRNFFRVPQERMNQEMRRIAQLGGKIISIQPLATGLTPWWVEIRTDNPPCRYYFGPFDSSAEASDHQSGYVEDLAGEGAAISSIKVHQCQPQVLTLEE